MILSILTVALLMSQSAMAQGAIMKEAASEHYQITDVLNDVEHLEYVDSAGTYFFVWSNQPGVLNSYLPGSDTNRSSKSTLGETYDPSTREWEGIPYITKTDGGRLWASIITGGYLEPDKLNYAVMYYSDDDGHTWSDEFLIIDRMTYNAYTYAPILHYENGRLYIYIAGGKVVYSDNADCENPSSEMKFSKSMMNTGCAFCHAPVKISDNFYISSCEHGAEPSSIRIVASTNLLAWEDISAVISSSPAVKKWNEGSIAKMSDGRLMMLGRIDGGTGVERAYSSDNGYNWSSTETDLPEPYIGPKSKLALVNLPSGGLLMVNHKSQSAREKLTCFLSYDDGETWPYELEIDQREEMNTFWGVSYPDVFVDKDGSFYIIWDQRDISQEIVIAKLTEDDIKAGKVVKSGSYAFEKVVRTGPCYDIKTVRDDFHHLMNVELGTKKQDIIDQLPATITYENEKGEVVENAKGTWKTEDYNSNQVGIYYFRFELENKPAKQLDSYRLLKVRVNVIDSSAADPENSGSSNQSARSGCAGSVAVAIAMPLAAIGGAGLLAIRRHKEED